MRKYMAILLPVCVVAYFLGIASCGDFDPAVAPYAVEIVFLNPEETITWDCSGQMIPGYEDKYYCNAYFADADWRWIEVTVMEMNSRTGGTAEQTGAPLNDVEIWFMTWPSQDDELYLPEDDRSALPPLTEPYFTRTDERGRAEIIWLFHGPMACGAAETHWIEASVGTTRNRLTIDVSCNPFEEGDDDEE